MKKLVVLCGFFAIFGSVLAIEIVVEEGGNKRIIKVPDDRQQDIVVKIDTKNSNTDGAAACVACPNTEKPVAEKPAVVQQKKPQAKKAKPKRPAAKPKAASSVISDTSSYQKRVEVVNVYHYFYPCSVNPNMKDCILDQDIKIDKNTDRLVIQKSNGPSPVDIIDKKTQTIIESPKDIGAVPVTTQSPVVPNAVNRSDATFDAQKYVNNAIPMDNSKARISETYATKQVMVVQPGP